MRFAEGEKIKDVEQSVVSKDEKLFTSQTSIWRARELDGVNCSEQVLFYKRNFVRELA